MKTTLEDKIDFSLEGYGSWAGFLEMLSVERTELFLTQMALPIRMEAFDQVMKLSRACLEVLMFPCLSHPPEPPFTWEFPEYWRKYREKGGTLGDTELRKYSDRTSGLRANEITFLVYTDYEEWVGSETSSALKNWFITNYQQTRSAYQNWLHEFWRFLHIRSGRLPHSILYPLSDEQWDSIKSFCDTFYTRKIAIRTQIRAIEEESRESPPTLWEAVLQTFPVDSSPGGNFPWLRHGIGEVLILQAFRSEWEVLREKMGPELIKNFVLWAEEQSRDEQNEEYLPDISCLSSDS